MMYSKNLLGSANSLCREWGGNAKNPMSYAVASRTSAVIGTAGAVLPALRACVQRCAHAGAGMNCGSIRTADAELELRPPFDDTLDCGFESTARPR